MSNEQTISILEHQIEILTIELLWYPNDERIAGKIAGIKYAIDVLKKEWIIFKERVNILNSWIIKSYKKYIKRKCRHICIFCKYKKACLETKWWL